MSYYPQSVRFLNESVFNSGTEIKMKCNLLRLPRWWLLMALKFCTCRLGIRALSGDFGENGLGSQHAALHCRVGAFDLWDVHEAGAAANQQPSRESQLRDGLWKMSRVWAQLQLSCVLLSEILTWNLISRTWQLPWVHSRYCALLGTPYQYFLCSQNTQFFVEWVAQDVGNFSFKTLLRVDMIASQTASADLSCWAACLFVFPHHNKKKTSRAYSVLKSQEISSFWNT